jgi:hypothetical protein
MTKDDFLKASLSLFKSHFRTDDSTGSMTAARAGLLLKQHFPHGLAEAGFQKFGDLLRELERQGSIRTGLDSKNVLAIWFPETSPPKGPFRPLRDDVWRSFVARRPEGNRYFNRSTGQVMLGLDSPPSLSDHWIQISPLSDDVQKKWATEFLAKENISDPVLAQSLETEPWYYHFGLAIDNYSADLSRKWKRWRSEGVLAYVHEWTVGNGISPSAVYQDFQDRQQPLPPAQIQSASPPSGEPDARNAVLSAIAMMPLEDLLRLPVPSKFLLEALRAEKLNGR